MSKQYSSLLTDSDFGQKSLVSTVTKSRLKMMNDRKRATKERLLKEIKRPKMILFTGSQDEVLPTSHYIRKARAGYLLKASKNSLSHSPSASITKVLQPFYSERRPKAKPRLNPITSSISENNFSSIYPEWLLSKPEFIATEKQKIEQKKNEVFKIVKVPLNERTEIQQELLLSWVSSVEYFKTLPKMLVSSACNKLICKKFAPGEALVREGDPADSLYIIYSGLIGVYIHSKQVATLQPKSTVGEIGLDSSMLRTATCIAEEPTKTFVLDMLNYIEVLQAFKKLEKLENTNLLMSNMFFQEWSFFKVQALSNCLIPKIYKKGEVIFEKDNESNMFYILKEGKVTLQTYVDIEQVNRWPNGVRTWNIRTIHKKHTVEVDSVNPGMFFGEIDLIEGCCRRTRAVASKNCICVVLNKKEFFSIFSAKDIQRMKEMSKYDVPSEHQMQTRILNEINSRKSKQKALIEAMQIDISNLGGRNLPFDFNKKKMQSWAKVLRGRHSGSIHNLRISVLNMNKELGRNKKGGHTS